MAWTAVALALLAVAVVLVIVGGARLVRREAGRTAGRHAARRAATAQELRMSVRSAARERGWQLEDTTGRTLLAAQRPQRADPIACELAVSGEDPRAFRAEVWSMRHHDARDAKNSAFVQHRLTMPIRVALPRFAVTGDGHWRTLMATIPDDLVSGGQRLGGLRVYGNDFLLAKRLLPLAGELRADKLWVLIGSDELCLIREGDTDADGLVRRVALAARLAAALEA